MSAKAAIGIIFALAGLLIIIAAVTGHVGTVGKALVENK